MEVFPALFDHGLGALFLEKERGIFHLKENLLIASPPGGLGAVDEDGSPGRAPRGTGDAQAQRRLHVKELCVLSPPPLLVLLRPVARAQGHDLIFEKALLFVDVDDLKPLWKMKSSSSTMQPVTRPIRKQGCPPTQQPGENRRLTYLVLLQAFQVYIPRFNTWTLKPQG